MGKKKQVRKSNDIILTIKKIEGLFCFIILIVFVVLLLNAFQKIVFLPATLIMGALECFSLGYYYRDNEKKAVVVYVLFGIGIVLLFISVVYTIMKTV